MGREVPRGVDAGADGPPLIEPISHRRGVSGSDRQRNGPATVEAPGKGCSRVSRPRVGERGRGSPVSSVLGLSLMQKFLAKIGPPDMNKAARLFRVIGRSEAVGFPCRKGPFTLISGASARPSHRRSIRDGIRTIGQLQRMELADLICAGIRHPMGQAGFLPSVARHRHAPGETRFRRGQESISAETTFNSDIADLAGTDVNPAHAFPKKGSRRRLKRNRASPAARWWLKLKIGPISVSEQGTASWVTPPRLVDRIFRTGLESV